MMKKDSNSKVETTSRRQFTRAMVTAAVAAPIAASMAGCRSQSGGSGTPITAASPGPTPTDPNGLNCCAPVEPLHIDGKKRLHRDLFPRDT